MTEEKHNILRRNDEMASFNQCLHYNAPQSKPLINIENVVASATLINYKTSNISQNNTNAKMSFDSLTRKLEF